MITTFYYSRMTPRTFYPFIVTFSVVARVGESVNSSILKKVTTLLLTCKALTPDTLFINGSFTEILTI